MRLSEGGRALTALQVSQEANEPGETWELLRRQGLMKGWGVVSIKKPKWDGGTKSRQLDQGDAGAEQNTYLCLLGSCPSEIQPWGCQILGTDPLALLWLNFGW